MSPWLVLVIFTAAINLFLFIFVRGRWDRSIPLVAVAALGGTVIGNAVGDVMRVGLVRIGDFNFLTASVIAQLAMLGTVLVRVYIHAARTEPGSGIEDIPARRR